VNRKEKETSLGKFNFEANKSQRKSVLFYKISQIPEVENSLDHDSEEMRILQ